MNLQAAENLARQLIVQHVPGWSFAWHNKRRSFGTCHYRRATIYLSRVLTETEPEEQVRDTILHEIAHAMTPGHKHGFVWKMKCCQIGCSGQVRSVPTVKPPYTWVLMFGDEVVTGYYRKPARVMRNVRRMFVPGRKAETLGNLRLVPA